MTLVGTFPLLFGTSMDSYVHIPYLTANQTEQELPQRKIGGCNSFLFSPEAIFIDDHESVKGKIEGQNGRHLDWESPEKVLHHRTTNDHKTMRGNARQPVRLDGKPFASYPSNTA